MKKRIRKEWKMCSAFGPLLCETQQYDTATSASFLCKCFPDSADLLLPSI